MNVLALTPQDTRRRNLVSIAFFAATISLLATIFEIYQGFTTQSWDYFLVAGGFLVLFAVSSAIFVSRRSEKPLVGTWHLLAAFFIAMLLLSAVRANIGAELGTALLILSLVISILTLPPEQVVRGAVFGVLASLATSAMVFYSPLPQVADARLDLIATWSIRGAMLIIISLAFTQFRYFSISNKLLISFLSAVVLISLAFNIVAATSTENSMSAQVGQQLHSTAEERGLIIGDYINGQVKVLQTFALDETIRQAVRAANALKPDLASITRLDEQWRQAVSDDSINSLINSRLSNSLSRDLRAFQALAPEHIEVFVTDRAGALVSTTNVTSDYYQADENWWISSYQGGVGDVYISQPEVDESANAFSILLAVPIFDTREGDLIGVLRTTISVENLISLLAKPIGETGAVDILFPDETILAVNEGEYEEISPESWAAIQDSVTQIYVRAVFEERDSIVSQGQVESQSGISSVDDLDWTIVVTQDAEEALAPVREQVRLTSFFATIMAGVAALLSLVFSQRLAQPIINLTETANKVAAGELNARAPIDSQDEIGQLAQSFNTMTSQLQETLVGLEERVAERTADVEESSHQLEKRAAQFKTIAQLARTITSIQDLETLLTRIAQLVSQQFGFYHVGLFLLDEIRQFAVLSAANSEGGQRMLARKHRLEVGRSGIVGYVTSTGNPRIALDTGADAVYFDNPDLPDTRSEMALPLSVGSTIIGALDVQSTEQNAFSEDDVEVLSILADEVSMAIENARLHEDSKRLLKDAQSAFGEYSREAWQNLSKSSKLVGYELSGTTIRSLDKPVKSNGSSLAIPIKLRNQVIGMVNIKLPDNKKLDPDEADIANALIERLGTAVESASLLEETRRRSAKEQAIGEISSKIGSSINMRNVLQTAVEELGRALPGSEVVIQFTDKDAPGGSK